MESVKDLMARKGQRVHSTTASSTVLDATRYMNEHGIGAVVVISDGENQVVGIFTERDVLRRIVAEERQPSTVRVADVMTTSVIYCTPEHSVEEVSRIMKDQRIRHLPVVDTSGNLLGLISIGDVNAFHASDQEATINYLSDYISGVY